MIITIVKLAVGTTASVGSGVFVKEALKQFTPGNMNAVKKACSVVGGVMIAGIVGKASTEYAEGMVNETVSIINEIKTKLSKDK